MWLKTAKELNQRWELPNSIWNKLDIPHGSIFHDESILEHTLATINATQSFNYDAIFGPILRKENPHLDDVAISNMINEIKNIMKWAAALHDICLLYTSPSPRDS